MTNDANEATGHCKVDRAIELDPHTTGARVPRFAEHEAAALTETIKRWLG